jgi:serine/threonine protein kinase
MSSDFLALPEGYRYRGGEIKLEFLEVLGGGGFGVVYRAYDATRGVEVAVKEYIPKQFAARSRSNGVEVVPKTPEDKRIVDWGLEHFVKESVKLLMFNHPGIVKVLARYEANRTAYIVMELVEGQTVSEFVRENGPVPLAQTPAMLRPLCSAIEYLHQRQYIHRDIKPSNIMLRNGDFTAPVLIDFGAARPMDSMHTRDLRQIWSEGYSAPELAGVSPPTDASDVYSLGAVACFVASGKRPASALNQTHPVASVSAPDARPNEQLARLISAINRSLEPDIAKRTPSAAAFRAIMDGEPLPQPTSPQRVQRRMSPPRPALGDDVEREHQGSLLAPAALSVAALLLVVLALLVAFGHVI